MYAVPNLQKITSSYDRYHMRASTWTPPFAAQDSPGPALIYHVQAQGIHLPTVVKWSCIHLSGQIQIRTPGSGFNMSISTEGSERYP